MDKSTFSIILAVLAIIIAGTAAFSLSIDLENSSFTIGVLTLLVTLLVGWQIYSKIDFDHKIRNAINKQVEKGSNMALFVALAQQGKSAYNRKDKTDAIQSLLNALCVWDDTMDTPLAKEAYEYCITRLLAIGKGIIFEVENPEERAAYIKATLRTGHQELINFATQIKIRDKKLK